jgi:hypothetical protein
MLERVPEVSKRLKRQLLNHQAKDMALRMLESLADQLKMSEGALVWFVNIYDRLKDNYQSDLRNLPSELTFVAVIAIASLKVTDKVNLKVRASL